MSEYQKVLEELKQKACSTCSGSGKVNDADIGDISFNEYTCPSCNGSGFEVQS